jgi:hypothetical protein
MRRFSSRFLIVAPLSLVMIYLVLIRLHVHAQSGGPLTLEQTDPNLNQKKLGPPFEIQSTNDARMYALEVHDHNKLVLSVDMDGKVTYGPGYEPNEAAKEFWKYVVHYAPGSSPPKPEWVPDPSAGHYDCPDGWTAFSQSEPNPHVDVSIATNAIYIAPPRDKKGHVLGSQPPPPICVQDSK